MTTRHALFPLADTPAVDLEQAGGTNVTVDETFATAERLITTPSLSQEASGPRMDSGTLAV